MAKPLETMMPAHTSAWYRDLYQRLHQVNRCSSELAWSLDSLGPLPTLPPDVFTEQSHFSITTRFETGLEWLGPLTQPVLLAASDLEGTIGGAGPRPCCSWWLGLTGALALKFQDWALT